MRMTMLATTVVVAALQLAPVSAAPPLCRKQAALVVLAPVRQVDQAVLEVESDACFAGLAARTGSSGRLTWTYTSTNQPDHVRHCVWEGNGAQTCTGRIYIPGTVTVTLRAEGDGQGGSLVLEYI